MDRLGLCDHCDYTCQIFNLKLYRTSRFDWLDWLTQLAHASTQHDTQPTQYLSSVHLYQGQRGRKWQFGNINILYLGFERKSFKLKKEYNTIQNGVWKQKHGMLQISVSRMTSTKGFSKENICKYYKWLM